MRWLTFVVCALSFVMLQTAVVPRLELFGVRADCLLVLVVFFALYARGSDAIIGAWLIGFLADLMTVEQMGLMSLSYSLAALSVLGIRDFLFRHRIVTQFVLTFFVCLVVRLGWGVYFAVQYPGGLGIGSALEVIGVSLYTAAISVPVFRMLTGLSRQFGLPQRRYTHSGIFSLSQQGV